MIEVREVSKQYGHVRAVRGVSLQAPPGVVTGLLGPNGAGKTTLIRMITGYLTPSAGRIGVCGRDTVDEADAARRHVGYLPESAPLYPEMSVEGYLRYRGGLFGVRGSARKAAVDRAIERCWLGEMRSRRIGALSKGYRQRVGLAAALLHGPDVLVLDEPTSGLDPTQIREMRALIRELAEGRTVLLSSHILPEVEQTCDRVVIIARGEKRADGTPGELLEPLRAAAPYVVEFAAGTEGARAEAALRGVAGVATVSECAGGVGGVGVGVGAGVGRRWRVTPTAGAGDLREALARGAAGAGLLAIELTRAAPTLEQFFMHAIVGGEAAGAGAVPAEGAAA